MESAHKNYFWRWLSGALLAFAAIPALLALRPAHNPQMPVAAGESWAISGEVVVQLWNSMPASGIAGLAQQYGIPFSGESVDEASRILDLHVTDSLVAGLLARLRSDSNV